MNFNIIEIMKIKYNISLVTAIFMISGIQQTSAMISDNEKAKKILNNELLYIQEPYGSWNVKNKQLILEAENPQKKRTNIWKMICDGSLVEVYLNNKKIIDIDLSDWEEAGKNPDGTKNKFNTAYKDMTRKGKIGFQDHGGKVWFRNLKIQKL